MKKTTFIDIRVTPETKDQLNAICKSEHRSQSEQITYWIDKASMQLIQAKAAPEEVKKDE